MKLLSQWWHFSFGNVSQFYNKIVSNFCRVIFWVISFLVSLNLLLHSWRKGEKIGVLLSNEMRWDEGEISVFSFFFLFCILSDFRYTHYSSPISVLLFGRLGYLPTRYFKKTGLKIRLKRQNWIWVFLWHPFMFYFVKNDQPIDDYKELLQSQRLMFSFTYCDQTDPKTSHKAAPNGNKVKV